MDAITEYKYMGTTIKVFSNRLEYQVGLKKDMIPFRNISSIDTPKMPLIYCIYIKTNDGKKHTIATSNPKKLREQISELL
jgi:hypothetical protein